MPSNDNHAAAPITPLAHADAVPSWCREPIGVRIDYNPFAADFSPSLCFDERLSRAADLADEIANRSEPRLFVVQGGARIGSPLGESISDGESASDEEPNGAIFPPAPSLEEQLWLDPSFRTDGMIVIDHGVFRAAMQQPLAPLQPLQPVQPPSIAPYQPGIPNTFDTLATTSIAELAAAVGGGPAQGVGQQQAQALAPTDLGALLQSSNSVQSVNTTRRSPVALAPTVRGYRFGQIYSQANGAYWFPVREDLDSMLSKIDPGMIQDVVVIPGPYGLRYGPGFSFIDIVTADTPRYDDGPGSDYRANGNIRTNGGQLYGRITADGGSDDYGYRISYGHRKGSDYTAGNGLNIPSSYDTGDVTAQFGFDLNKHQHVEASYLRLDGADTEYPDQFFDVDTLATNGATLRLVDDDPDAPWSNFKLEGWWNRTNFTGSITPEKSRPTFPQITRVEFALNQAFPGTDNTVNGNTLGANVSGGTRAVMLYGDVDDRYLRTGADFRYLEQGLRENYLITTQQITPPGPTTNQTFFTNLPFSRLRDEGLFAEYGFPLVDGWNVALGGRADWTDTNALLRDVRPDTNLDVDELVQHDDLYSYYLTNELKLNDVWTLNLGYGYAQRPPTLTERYADGVFLGVLQSGFTRVIGDPALRPERDFQLDAGLNAKYDNFRGSLTGFYSWVVDYITFDGLTVTDFFDAKLVRYRNTPLATLTGFEASGEWDWTCMFTPFATIRYVQGTDEFVGPLFGIPPLEGTVGFRWHDSAKQRNWEFEAGTRIVNQQNRLGEILILGAPTVIEERTGGFTTTYIRGYYNWSKNLKLVAGIDNVFNRSYQEHLDLRLLGPTGFPAGPTRVLSPGITPYFGIDWTF